MKKETDEIPVLVSIWRVIFLIIILVLSLIVFHSREDVKSGFWLSKVTETYIYREFNNGPGTPTTGFDDIHSLTEFSDWLKKMLSDAFYHDKAPYMSSNFVLYGPLRINTERRWIIDCDDTSIQKICFDANKKRSTKALSDDQPALDWYDWKSAGEKKFGVEINGDFGDYSGDGYTLDFYPTQIERAEFQTQINAFFSKIDAANTHVSVTFPLYSPVHES